MARATLAAALHTADGNPGGRAAAAAHLALVSLIEGDAGPAAALTTQAMTPDPPSEVAALARFVQILGLAVQGRHADAERELARRRAGADPAAVEEARALSGILALWAEDAGGAAVTLGAVGRDGAPPMSVQGRIMVLGHLGDAQYRLGDWDAAAANGALAVSLVRDAGVLLGGGVANALAAPSRRAAGLGGRAATRRGRDHGGRAPARGGAPGRTRRPRRRCSPRPAATTRRCTTPWRPTPTPPSTARSTGSALLPWRALRVEALLGLGRIDEAETALTELEDRLAGRPPGWSALEAARLRCGIAELRASPTVVRRAYERAMILAEDVPAELGRARLEIAFGRFLLAAGERRPAVDLLRTAHARLDRLGATPFLDRCDELLKAAGLHPPTAGGALDLTPQELAVARLVAEGRTNQEAGAALFVTGRTVAFHLSNIYAKLGVSSRRELAAQLRRLHG